MSLNPAIAETLVNGAVVHARAACAGAMPDPEYLVSDWADEYRVLTARSSPEPGRWRTERTPYLREIMDDLSPHSKCYQVVFQKGAQIGGTEAANNWIGFCIAQAPGPMLSVQPTVEMAKRNSKQRIGPLIDECPELDRLVAQVHARGIGTSSTLLSKEFPGGILVMTGANSAKGLRSMSARYLILDEVDGYPGDADGEGEPCALAIARTTNFPRRKILIVSTPVKSGMSRIERFYDNSDQRQYWVPCPQCKQLQVLIFSQLRWPEGLPNQARYICEHCQYPIRNSQKGWMLAQGKWVAQAEDRGVHGYHLSSLYSPVGWLSWEQIAAKYEAASEDAEQMQAFTNTILGLAWSDVGEVPDTDRLYERREQYGMGTVPLGGLMLTAGVDVQMRRLEVEVVAWGRDRQSWSVDYRVFDGDTSQPTVWKNLEAMLDEDFPTEAGHPLRITRMAVDSGFNTMAVYDFVRRMLASRVIAIKGSTRASALIGAASMIEVGPQGSRIRYGIRLWPVNTNIAKEELYRSLRSRMPDLSAGETWPVGFCHFPEYSREYFEQLTAEQLVTHVKGGVKTMVWEKRRNRNEALDCRIYARAAAASMRFENWGDARWDGIEAKLKKDRIGGPVPSAVKPQVLNQGGVSTMPVFTPMPAKESFLE